MTPRKLTTWIVLAAVTCGGAVGARPAWSQAQQQQPQQQQQQVDPAAVQTAIRKGVEFIYSKQKPDGSWEESPKRLVDDPNNKDDKGHESYSITGGQWGGQTALTTYALLAAGESPANEKIQKAVTWLRAADIQGVYALGMRAQIWQFLPKSPENLAGARRDWGLLANGIRTQQGKKGFGTYDYMVNTKNLDRMDLSVTQYGVLGAWSVAQAGVEVPTNYWRGTQGAWVQWQQGNGGWAYTGTPDAGHPINLPITAAGVATLFITQDYLHSNEGLKCTGNVTNKHIDAGLKFITDNIGELLKSDGNRNKNVYYTLYGIERIGVASGLKYFGSTDWYQLGAKWLLEKQNKQNGSWNGGTSSSAGGGFCDNAFSLIFLSRGSAPVAINKLQYQVADKGKTEDGHWNQRPRDVANVVRWMSKNIEKDLNWQIVNLKVQATDLLDAPLLYMAGDQKLELAPEDEAKLKDYVEQGGIIVGHSDCATGGKEFQASFRKMGEKLFGSEFRELPENHPIYNIRFKRAQMKQKPRWLGLSNGARELMVLIPDDPAKSWQTQAYGDEAGWQTMMNLFLYSVDTTGARAKGYTHLVRPDPKATAKQTIKVARAEYPGRWNPEPGGWRRMSAILLNEKSVGLDVSTVKLGEGDIPADVQVLHLTGTEAFQLPAEGRAALSKFVQGGGTLVIDAAGGASAFRTSARDLLTMLFPGQASQLDQVIKPDHPIFSAAGKAADVKYRMAARPVIGNVKVPQLRGIEINGRLAVILSNEDLSVGMVGQAVEGIVGYDPQAATDLMKNILMYAGKKKE